MNDWKFVNQFQPQAYPIGQRPGTAAHHDRGEEQATFVDEPGLQRLGRQMRAADTEVPVGRRPARDTIAALAGLGIRAEAVTTRKPTLDDVYLRLTGSRLAA